MARYLPLKQSSPGAFVQVKLPEAKWINFNMHKTQFLFLGQFYYQKAWGYTWKAILLASGVAHDGSTDPSRFLLSEHDDHALAVLLRTTMLIMQVGESEILIYVTGKPIFSWVSGRWAEEEAIEIVYPSQLSKDEAARFSVRGEPLQVIEYKAKTENEV